MLKIELSVPTVVGRDDARTVTPLEAVAPLVVVELVVVEPVDHCVVELVVVEPVDHCVVVEDVVVVDDC